MDCKKKRILIVDDEEINVQIMKAALKADYDVDTAHDGYAAIRTIAAQKPDLILLDVMMPDLSGFEVCKVIKADDALADIPVIFLTAMNSAGNELEGLEAGGIDYITKPFNIDAVRLRIKNHLLLAGSVAKRAVTGVTQEHGTGQKPVGAWRLAAPESRLYTPDGYAVMLSGQECILLEILLGNAGANVTYEMLCTAMNQIYDIYAKARLEVLVCRLRAKVTKSDRNAQLPIKARRNTGYIFLAEPPPAS